jgi:hypothetical protein
MLNMFLGLEHDTWISHSLDFNHLKENSCCVGVDCTVEPITSLVCNKGLKLITSPLFVGKINQATKDFASGHSLVTT